MSPNINQFYKKTFQRTKLPPLEIELILAHVLKKSREYMLAHQERQLTPKQISNFKFQILKRMKGMPIAYITGHKEFFGLNFLVNKNVLIPRPETELMVEEAIKLIKHNAKQVTIIDVGTGSGCIIITLAKLLNGIKKSDFGYSKSYFLFLATDTSKPALAVARQNAELHQLNKKIKFFQGSLLLPILKSKILNHKSKIVILANLPYLTPNQIKNSPSIRHEPKQALDGGNEGLKYYSQLFKQINFLFHNTRYIMNNTVYLLCEIDHSQTLKIKKLIKEILPKSFCQIKKDLSGLNRLVIINL